MKAEPNTFVVIVDDAVVYRCRTLGEGLAFLAGRGTGVLCGVLCGAVTDPPRPKSGKREKQLVFDKRRPQRGGLKRLRRD